MRGVFGLTLSPRAVARWRWWLSLACLPALNGVAMAAEALAPAWEAMADNRAKDAFILLHGKEPGGSRERELARGVALLDQQPVTDEQLRSAEAIFVRLAESEDEVAQIAAYLQARLYHVHFQTRDYARARELYAGVARRWPSSHWGQLAVVKSALILLYAAEPKDPQVRVARAEEMLAQVKETPLRRDLQLQIGRAITFYELPAAEALPHLQAADAIGGLGALAQQDLTAQLGELSFRAGHWADARKYFKRYLVQYPDARQFTVEQKLKQIDERLAAEKEGGS